MLHSRVRTSLAEWSSSSNCSKSKARGFTLIELLVVITIIVVLLSLLTPALDKAIYQAELAVCAAQLDSISGGATTYAMGARRSYPYREGVRSGQSWMPSLIYNGSQAFNAFFGAYNDSRSAEVSDDRPMLRTFISLDNLMDPLAGAVDLEDVDFDAHGFSSVSLWFGYGHPGHAGMYKMGNRWTAPDTDGNGNSPNGKYNVIAADMDLSSPIDVQATHPDADGRLFNNQLQNQDFIAGFKVVWSLYQGGTGRGDADLNYAFQDGSVQRLTEVGVVDDRIVRTQYYNFPSGWWSTIPR